ncbi:hypothetical protein TRFO_08876 [Tritrichomonas foetus]|uniref:UBX domain-containing protein n=1 Tax=Tritrichomonas foetus TaxID=1144522 RepID=A0A1J4JLZ4_9EUKA|nr:hypothetical protein TRFO_08876 [Tritrichomonas foetus]|eukprot:OHS98579.1 hypothetical protein TRFO_08876 [Tritrichomonas foetus]
MNENINQFFAINNGYDDEEAFQTAVQQSLQTELVPPDRRLRPEIASRYSEATLNNPVSEKACRVIDMVQKTRQKLDELIHMDLTACPPKSPTRSIEEVNASSPVSDRLSESQEIRRQQNEEYQIALANAQAQERARQEEEEEAPEQIDNYGEMIQQKFSEIGEEPQNGLLLAVALPSGQRISRKFNPDTIANDVYIWVAANENMVTSGARLDSFNIVGPTGTILDSQKTLNEQSIASRTLFSIFDV